MPDPADENRLNEAAFQCAKDLARRMLERRHVSPSAAPGLVRFLGARAAGLCRAREPLGYPALRHATEIVGRLIERGRISDRDGAAAGLASAIGALDAAAAKLPPERVRPVMAASCEYVLKLLETVTLSAEAVPGTLAELSAAFLDVLEGRAS
jgi:hypothetical protein